MASPSDTLTPFVRLLRDRVEAALRSALGAAQAELRWQIGAASRRSIQVRIERLPSPPPGLRPIR